MTVYRLVSPSITSTNFILRMAVKVFGGPPSYRFFRRDPGSTCGIAEMIVRFGKNMQATKVRVSESEGFSKFRVKTFIQYISTIFYIHVTCMCIVDSR